ncbi:hypothetical protein BHM03_00002861 [Ensete ventricosum]|uniref:DUF2062 domain-containing protein n=1 Tax=Ensete ventricosum TaxID=4639 RepID=A0A445M9T0_ENSVE|nr:hypothetical protein BHM03_00002861 [Ensete ventricosum]
MDSFGVVAFPKYTAARNDRSSHSEHEKVFKKRIEEGEAKSLPSSSAKHLLNRWSATRKRNDLFFSGGFVVKMPIWGVGLTPWLRTKVVDPLTQIIGRGAEPKQLAFSTALGVTLGVFPICGKNQSMLIGRRSWFKVVLICIHSYMRFLNSDSYHLRFLLSSLVVPFVRLGEVISGGPHFPLTSDALKKVVTGEATRDVLISVLHAVSQPHTLCSLYTINNKDYVSTNTTLLQLLGWVVAAPFILGALYAVFIPCFKFLIHRFNAAPESPKKQRAI